MPVTVNGTPLSTLGIEGTRIRGWSDGVELGRDAVQIPGYRGRVEGTTVEASPRTVQVEGLVRNNTVGTRNAVIEEALAHMRGRCEIVPDDQTSKLVVGYLETSRVTALSDLLTMDKDIVDVRLDFVCYDPLFRDTEAQVASFDATARDVPMGTGPHRGTVTITGEPTDPTLTVKDFRGDTVATMEFTGTLAADEAWIVDLYEHTITLSDSGVESAADSVLSGGAFFHFEAAWADHVSEAWPTLEIDAGSGSFTYYRRWQT